MEELLTVAEIAAYLKVNQQTARNWIDSGFLTAIRIGRQVRVKRSHFHALLEAGYTGNKPKKTPRPRRKLRVWRRGRYTEGAEGYA